MEGKEDSFTGVTCAIDSVTDLGHVYKEIMLHRRVTKLISESKWKAKEYYILRRLNDNIKKRKVPD